MFDDFAISMAPQAATVLLLPAVPIGLWVAWSDLSRMKIPNHAVLAALLCFVALGPFLFPLSEFGWRLVQGGAILLVGFVLNVVRFIGAGDAKFAAAMAPYFAAADGPPALRLFAGVLLAAFFVHRGIRAVPALRGIAPNWESWGRRDFPMGFALGGTLIFYLSIAALS